VRDFTNAESTSVEAVKAGTGTGDQGPGRQHTTAGTGNREPGWNTDHVHKGQGGNWPLALRAIEYSSRAGENVADFFGGSGSTLIASEKMGRRCFMMELDPLYADVIVHRWEQFAGRKAERVPQ